MLWSALIARLNPDSLEPTLECLINSSRSGVLLAGVILGYGLGSERSFLNWLGRAKEFAIWEQGDSWGRIFPEPWRSSNQVIRKEKISTLLLDEARTATWPVWSRLDSFSKAGGFQGIPRPEAGLASAFNSCLYRESVGNNGSAMSLAMERILAGITPAWPLEPVTFRLLQLWPARRRLIGYRLQLAALCGFDRNSIQALAGRLLQDLPCQVSEVEGILSKDGRANPVHSASLEARDILRDWAVHELPGYWRSPRSFDVRLHWPMEAWISVGAGVWRESVTGQNGDGVTRVIMLQLTRSPVNSMFRHRRPPLAISFFLTSQLLVGAWSEHFWLTKGRN